MIPKRLLIALLCLVSLFQQLKGQDTSLTGHKPVFITKEITRVEVDKQYHYRFNAMDSMGRALTYWVGDLPGWLHFDSSKLSISGRTTSPGQYQVRILAICGKDTARQYFMLTVFNDRTTNILCLGNSITNGVDVFNSYRRDLWFMLHQGNYNFDFIGSWSKHHMGTEVPNPDFDMDHEGHSGWTLQDIFQVPDWDSARGNINIWLKSYTPDMVLVELGTNDVFHCRKLPDIMADMAKLVTVLRAKNPAVRIFIAQIPPLGNKWASQKLCKNDTTYDQSLRTFNQAIPGFVRKCTTKVSPVIVVDQYSGINPAIDTFDDIHPNNRGEQIMAQRWFNAIHRYLSKLP